MNIKKMLIIQGLFKEAVYELFKTDFFPSLIFHYLEVLSLSGYNSSKEAGETQAICQSLSQ